MQEEGVIIFWESLDMEQCAIRAVLSQQPAKQQATVTQRRWPHLGETTLACKGHEKARPLLQSNTPNTAFHKWRLKAKKAKHGATIITRSVRRRTDALWEGIRKREHSKCIDRWISLET
jgi:hypothetical protein